MNIDFTHLSDKEIAESLYRTYGKKLVGYSIKSWQLSEDDAWDILYETLYKFIYSYSGNTFPSQQQIDALIWQIFKNKLRDYLRKKNRIEKEYQEVSTGDCDGLESPDSDTALWARCVEDLLSRESDNNLVLKELEKLLDQCSTWERQLLISRANNISYKTIAQYTGKKEANLKVQYQRLIKRIQSSLEQKFSLKREKNG